MISQSNKLNVTAGSDLTFRSDSPVFEEVPVFYFGPDQGVILSSQSNNEIEFNAGGNFLMENIHSYTGLFVFKSSERVQSAVYSFRLAAKKNLSWSHIRLQQQSLVLSGANTVNITIESGGDQTYTDLQQVGSVIHLNDLQNSFSMKSGGSIVFHNIGGLAKNLEFHWIVESSGAGNAITLQAQGLIEYANISSIQSRYNASCCAIV